jgi:hypothetical protein
MQQEAAAGPAAAGNGGHAGAQQQQAQQEAAAAVERAIRTLQQEGLAAAPADPQQLAAQLGVPAHYIRALFEGHTAVNHMGYWTIPGMSFLMRPLGSRYQLEAVAHADLLVNLLQRSIDFLAEQLACDGVAHLLGAGPLWGLSLVQWEQLIRDLGTLKQVVAGACSSTAMEEAARAGVTAQAQELLGWLAEYAASAEKQLRQDMQILFPQEPELAEAAAMPAAAPGADGGAQQQQQQQQQQQGIVTRGRALYLALVWVYRCCLISQGGATPVMALWLERSPRPFKYCDFGPHYVRACEELLVPGHVPSLVAGLATELKGLLAPGTVTWLDVFPATVAALPDPAAAEREEEDQQQQWRAKIRQLQEEGGVWPLRLRGQPLTQSVSAERRAELQAAAQLPQPGDLYRSVADVDMPARVVKRWRVQRNHQCLEEDIRDALGWGSGTRVGSAQLQEVQVVVGGQAVPLLGLDIDDGRVLLTVLPQLPSAGAVEPQVLPGNWRFSLEPLHHCPLYAVSLEVGRDTGAGIPSLLAVQALVAALYLVYKQGWVWLVERRAQVEAVLARYASPGYDDDLVRAYLQGQELEPVPQPALAQPTAARVSSQHGTEDLRKLLVRRRPDDDSSDEDDDDE